jgi:dipeptidyl aminopeptidase/acylaminoacyl peptidase
MVNELKKYGKEHKYIIKGDEGHGFRTETARLELFEDYEKFLAEYLN